MFFGVDPPKFPEIGQAHRVHARRQRRKNIENRSRLFFAFPYFYNEKISTIEKTQKRSKLAQYGAAINSDETNWNELWNSKHGSIRFLLSNDSNHRPNSTDFIVIHRGNITSRPINVITFKTAKVVWNPALEFVGHQLRLRCFFLFHVSRTFCMYDSRSMSCICSFLFSLVALCHVLLWSLPSSDPWFSSSNLCSSGVPQCSNELLKRARKGKRVWASCPSWSWELWQLSPRSSNRDTGARTCFPLFWGRNISRSIIHVYCLSWWTGAFSVYSVLHELAHGLWIHTSIVGVQDWPGARHVLVYMSAASVAFEKIWSLP